MVFRIFQNLSVIVQALVCIAALGASASATPPPIEVFGLNKAGAVYRFDKSTGAASLVRALNLTKVSCEADSVYGLLFHQNLFYTTCKSSSSPQVGKMIRFSFTPGDEHVFATSINDGFQRFDRILRSSPANEPLTMYVRAVYNGAPNDKPWGLYNTATKVFYYSAPVESVNGMQFDSSPAPACGPNDVSIQRIQYLEHSAYPGGPLVVGLNTSGPAYLGRIVSGCFQLECTLDTGSMVAPHGALRVGYFLDAVKKDQHTGEVWGVSSHTLVKLRNTSLTNYCTGTYVGRPAVNPTVDDAPRAIGPSNIATLNAAVIGSATPINGLDFAPNYFDNPPPVNAWEPIRMLMMDQ